MAYLYAAAHTHRNGHRESMSQLPVRYRLKRFLVYSTQDLYNDSVFSFDCMVKCLLNHESERAWKETVMA
jgi:hypothetical protein